MAAWWRRCGVTVLALWVAVATTPARAAGAGAPSQLTLGAATVGGVWYLLGGAWAEAIQKEFGTRVAVIEGGSIANLMGLAQNTYQIAFSNGEVIPDAYAGAPPFRSKLAGFSSLAALYPNPMHIVVRRDSNIRALEDLRGKRVSPGIRGYSGEIILQRLLELHGVSFRDLGQVVYTGTADAANLLRDGHLDAWGGVLAAPNGTILELATTPGIRLLTVPEATLQKMAQINSGYVPFTIPSGTYPGVNYDVRTVAPFTVLLARDDLSEEFVYGFMRRILFGQRQRWAELAAPLRELTPEFAYRNLNGPIHPGALRFYREAGVVR